MGVVRRKVVLRIVVMLALWGMLMLGGFTCSSRSSARIVTAYNRKEWTHGWRRLRQRSSPGGCSQAEAEGEEESSGMHLILTRSIVGRLLVMIEWGDFCGFESGEC